MSGSRDMAGQAPTPIVLQPDLLCSMIVDVLWLKNERLPSS
ncbi:MAG: hypothetical protein ABIV47_06800 [Roseiflexaceae bacterium]